MPNGNAVGYVGFMGIVCGCFKSAMENQGILKDKNVKQHTVTGLEAMR
jgi:hypothetical protein